MTRAKRKLLGRYTDLTTRHVVFITDLAVEVDEQDGFDIRRKRVFFEDVLMVTTHERTGIMGPFFIFAAAFALFIIAALLNKNGGWIAALIGLGLFVFAIFMLVVKETVITIFGRRSKARLRFSLRKKHAHRLYDDLCARVRSVQSQFTQEEAPAYDVDQNDAVREG